MTNLEKRTRRVRRTTGRTRTPHVLERIHRQFKATAKWLPGILDSSSVVLIHVILALLAFKVIIHWYPG